jgi:hypothetical protein
VVGKIWVALVALIVELVGLGWLVGAALWEWGGTAAMGW